MMGIESALIALLGSGVIEKSILVWMILQFNQQNNAIAEFKNRLTEIASKSQRIEDLRVELVLLRSDLSGVKERCPMCPERMNRDSNIYEPDK